MSAGIAVSHAAILYTTSSGSTEPTASSTDLLQTSLASKGAGNPNPTTGWDVNGDVSADGTVGNGTLISGALEGTRTLEYFLDISTNTLGYDIQQIDVYSGWSDSRAGHRYSLDISFVGDESWTSVTITGGPVNTGVLSGVFGESHLFDDGGGLIGTGVDALRFNSTAIGQGNVWREVDVIGTATTPIPEPSVASLMAFLFTFGLILRRRRA